MPGLPGAAGGSAVDEWDQVKGEDMTSDNGALPAVEVLGFDGAASDELRERICRLREVSHDYPARPMPAPAPSAN